MPHRHIQFSDHSKQAALFETMLLVAGADGRITRNEIDEIYRRVFERPEFKGIGAQDLKDALNRAADQLQRGNGLDQVLDSLAKRLPDLPSRRLAFGLAAAVATADRKALPRELEFLKALQGIFGIAEEEVVQLFDAAERRMPLPTGR
jgi:uncharacterized tellurite resistance protein B-like protein